MLKKLSSSQEQLHQIEQYLEWINPRTIRVILALSNIRNRRFKFVQIKSLRS